VDATGENRHRERMQRKKAVVDAAIARATDEPWKVEDRGEEPAIAVL